MNNECKANISRFFGFSSNSSHILKCFCILKDNWGLLYAQRLAIKNQLPLYICFCLVPTFLGATMRHYSFMIEGLKEVEMVFYLNKINSIAFLILFYFPGASESQNSFFCVNRTSRGSFADFY